MQLNTLQPATSSFWISHFRMILEWKDTLLQCESMLSSSRNLQFHRTAEHFVMRKPSEIGLYVTLSLQFHSQTDTADTNEWFPLKKKKKEELEVIHQHMQPRPVRLDSVRFMRSRRLYQRSLKHTVWWVCGAAVWSTSMRTFIYFNTTWMCLTRREIWSWTWFWFSW